MLWPSRLARRARYLLRRGAAEREMDEEMHFHVEQETAELVRAGVPPAEARRRARLAFGGVERFKEEGRDGRGTRGMEDLARDARLAVRRLRREPGFTVPMVATLALGIGVTAAVCALVYGVLLRPLPYRDADRLVAVGHTASGVELPMNGLSNGTFEHYRAHNRVFEDVALYVERQQTITDLDRPEQLRLARVSPNFFGVLGVRPSLGRLPVPADFVFRGPTGVLLSHALWMRRYGGDSSVIGRTIEIERYSNIIVGVAEPGFHFPDAETQAWTVWPQEVVRAALGEPRRASLRYLAAHGIARLRTGVTAEDATRDLQRLVRAIPTAFPEVTAEQLETMGLRATVVPLREHTVGNARAALLLLFGTAAFLLLITWANITNLALVRAERLRREAAVARALGATTAHLARRFLVEGTVVAFAGGAIGLVLAYAAVAVRFGFAVNGLPRLREVAVDGVAIGFAVVLTLLSAALVGLISLRASRGASLAGALSGAIGRMTASPAEQTARRVLVGSQVALALTLLIGSALMAQSFWRLMQVDLGFQPAGAVTFFLPIPPGEYSNYHRATQVHDEMLTRIRAIPSIASAEAANIGGFPLMSVPAYYNARVTTPSLSTIDTAAAPYARFSFATPGYFRTMGIPLLRGRTFDPVDTSREAPGVIVSAALARALFGDDDPVGQRMRWAGRTPYPDYTVVGVAGDVPGQTLRAGPLMTLYFPNLFPPRADTVTGVVHDYIPSDEMYVVRGDLPLAALVPAIRRAIRDVDPKLVMTRIGTLDQLVADAMAQARLTMLLLSIGAVTALALGMVGLYGVLSYMVSQRTAEIGVRIALGASPTGVVALVVRQGARLALGGIVVGLLAALALTRLLGSLLYEVSPSDPVAFGAMAALLLAVALAASYLPARRAGRIDPVRALKGE